MRKDIICYHCHENEANFLIFYEKQYNGLKSFQQPTLICLSCRGYFKTASRLFESKPVILSFIKISKMPARLVSWFASDKGKVQNDMACAAWRKKLFRIKKIGEGRAKAWTNQMPMAL